MKASFVMNGYLNNAFFDIESPIINQDNRAYPYYHLKLLFQKYGIDLSSKDINPPHESDIVIYYNMPKVPRMMPLKADKHKSFLLCQEPPMVHPWNEGFGDHEYFSKIFTWDDSWVDNQTYFKCHLAVHPPENRDSGPFERPKFCTTVVGNKTSNHPLELYSKRLDIMQWFERHHPREFEFYGTGWEPLSLSHKPVSVLWNHFIFKKPLLKSYQGRLHSKNDVLKNYRFAICFENGQYLPGYITEKIFDCFFAGCIPIYWGAPNITAYIPKTCFIDFRAFKNYADLYEYLVEMDEDTYLSYRQHIEQFLASDGLQPFLSESFAKAIVHPICNQYNVSVTAVS